LGFALILNGFDYVETRSTQPTFIRLLSEGTTN
jgi:hypothetical protein